MTSMLPPTRDLPPGRHAQIRAELERAAGGRKTSRLTVPILAAAASVLAVAAGIAVLRPDPSEPAPAVQITTSPTLPAAPDFGVSQETIAAIEEGCAKSAGVGKATLHQLRREETTWAVLYTEREELTCSIGVGGMEYNSSFGQTSVQYLPGHFSVDGQTASAGGDVMGRPAYLGVPGNRTVVGRVGPKVAKVTYTVDGKTVEAKIANGTYAARIYYPPTWGIGEPTPEVVRAYDEKGAPLGASTDLETTCYYSPDMTVVYGTRKQENADCKPVSPWPGR
ncbi:hypothetical protein ABZ345_38845 [Lentzea sp. NPDC005914]|uniref:hypothetical protein n=1 Tax=Lentzea sp. NPDC005914 TaxID=3154572 RepID=UPI0033EC85E9